MNKRLLDIASLIEKSKTMADIGTDHGYLPIYMVKNNIVDFAYASDVAIGPLNKAKENIANNHLEDKIEAILADGLKGIPSNVDQIVIAGMGGDLIVKILSESNNKYETLILQPNIHADKVRKYLIDNDYQIVDELISYDSKKYYQIIKAKKGNQELNDLQLKYGPINLIKKEKLFNNMLNEEKESLERIIKDFKGSDNELNQIKFKLSQIESIL